MPHAEATRTNLHVDVSVKVSVKVGVEMTINDFSLGHFGLSGKNAIVTGGNTGLGQAFALALAKGGANVFVPSIIDDDGSTRSLIEGTGARYAFMEADITADGAPKHIIDSCVEAFGSIDILINSAGDRKSVV